MDWFLYDNGIRHERVNQFHATGIVLFLLSYDSQVWKQAFFRYKNTLSFEQNGFRPNLKVSFNLN